MQPKKVSKATHLTELSLVGNTLRVFPVGVTALVNLRSLHLGGNGLVTLPPEYVAECGYMFADAHLPFVCLFIRVCVRALVRMCARVFVLVLV